MRGFEIDFWQSAIALRHRHAGRVHLLPTLALATTLERLNSRNEAEAGDENRQFTPIRMWIGSYRVVAVVPEPPR